MKSSSDRRAADGSALAQLVLVLLTETVSSREEVPAPLLVHLPHIGLLQGEKTASPAVVDVLFKHHVYTFYVSVVVMQSASQSSSAAPLMFSDCSKFITDMGNDEDIYQAA